LPTGFQSIANIVNAKKLVLVVARYNTVIVWCETFPMFITAAKYR
jgi:hypothetical protein